MVTPDAHFLDVSDLAAGLQCELSECSVMIETRHGREVLLWNTLGVLLENEAVGVGWITNDDGLAISLGVIVHGLSNTHENLSIILEEIGSLHTWASWLRANHESVIEVFESDGWITGANDLFEERESAVVELSTHTGQCLLHERQINQMQNNSLIFSKELSCSNSEQDRVGNVSCSAGNSDPLWWLVADASGIGCLR